MKTTQQWLDTIQDTEIKVKALNNAAREGTLSVEMESLPAAIGLSFSWINCPEGPEYWNSYYITL